MTLTHLNTFFTSDQIFCMDMVSKRKPEPDVFLLAARHFQVQPENCLVIEDHALGIKAAQMAHMPVIGFSGGSHAKNAISREKIVKAAPTLAVNNALELLATLTKLLDKS